jgi:GT2 family glycosyltransferase
LRVHGQPELTFVMATYQRRDLACRAVMRLADQTAPHGALEIVVVVDGSTDGTDAALQALTMPFPLRVIVQANTGQAAALNRGVAEARAPVCLFLDDDTEADPRVAELHLEAHAEGPVVAVGRLVTRPAEGKAPLTGAMARWLNEHYDHLERRPLDWQDCYGSNTSMRRDDVLAAGGLRTDLPRGYDTELALRLRDRGADIVYLRDARAAQRLEKSSVALVRDFIDEGRADVAIWRRHPPILEALKLGHRGEPPTRARGVRWLLRGVAGRPRVLSATDAVMGRTPVATRWHSLVRDACYWHGAKQAATRHEWATVSRTVPILLYHAIARPGEAPTRYVVPADRLARQLRLLRFFRRRPVSLADYVSDRREGRPPAPRTVVLTLDDGFRDVVQHGLPVLRRAGVPATLFVVTGCRGQAAAWVGEGPLAARPMASEEELRRWLDGGMAVGAHTKTHPRLPTLGAEAVTDELAGGADDLRDILGRPADLFAYPYGDMSDAVRDEASHVYRAACSARPGLNSAGTSLFELRRVEIDGRASLLRFCRALLGADALVRRHGEAADP